MHDEDNLYERRECWALVRRISQFADFVADDVRLVMAAEPGFGLKFMSCVEERPAA